MVSNPTPESYPSAFSIAFVTNITSTTGSSTDHSFDDKDYPIAGKLWYDWTHKRQRIDHAAGSYECVRFYNHTRGPGSLIFLPDGQGMYRLLYDKTKDVASTDSAPDGNPTISAIINSDVTLSSCCLDLPSVGAPPPTWAADAHPTYNGIVHDAYTGEFGYQWTFDHTSIFLYNQLTSLTPLIGSFSSSSHHTLRQVAWSRPGDVARPPSQSLFAPLVFTFPAADGLQDFHYQLDTLVVGPLDDNDNLFTLPDGCEFSPCPRREDEVVEA